MMVMMNALATRDNNNSNDEDEDEDDDDSDIPSLFGLADDLRIHHPFLPIY